MCDSKCGCGCHGACKCIPSKIGKTLVVIGGINWGLVGLGMLLGKMDAWNVVHMILGSMPMFEAIVYLLVGIAAVITIFGCRCKKCMAGCTTCSIDANKTM
jgi:uncharacterized membrane protein YuzA (DUF378 family)